MKPLWIRTCSTVVLALLGVTSSCSQGWADGAETGKGTVTSPQAYVDQFIRKDAETCFSAVDLSSARVEGKQEISGSALLRRAIILVDGSGSMAGRLDGRSKLDLARQAARTFIDSLPPDVETSLIVFGLQGDNTRTGKEQSCSAVDTLAPMTTDRAALVAALGKIKAVGWTPLAAAIEQARTMLQSSSAVGEQVIYVVSDGEETCGGDPVETARRAHHGQTRAIVNIVGFGLPAKEAAALQSVAMAGGGTFVDVHTKQTFDEAMAAVREANRRAGNEVRASNAASSNAVDTAAAISRANLCISDIVSDESNRMSNDLTARASRGEPVPYMREALSLLQTRHKELNARVKAFSERLSTAERDARMRMNKAKDAAH